jgi:hypothetical protein
MTMDRPDDVRDPESFEPAFRIGRWPFGMLVVAALRIFDAVTLAAIALGVGTLPVEGLPILASSPVLTQSAELAIAGATILGVVGLLAFRRWGWVLTMILVGLGLGAELVRVSIGQPDHLGLLLLVVSAFYLNQRSVRAIAGQHLDSEPTYR